MRGFQRDPEPDALRAAWEALTTEWLRRVNAATPGKAAAWTWGPVIGGKSIRDHILPVLKKQTSSHCSYCDLRFVAAGSDESVDHFLPKAKVHWPELAYTWNNLFYACGGCQSAKRTNSHPLALKPDEPGYQWMDYLRKKLSIGCD